MFPKQSSSTQYLCHSYLSPAFGILDWTKQELENLDINTRKLLTASGSFHSNSNIDRLYCYHKNDGRGLNSIADTFMSRIISLSLHLKMLVVIKGLEAMS